MQEEFNALRINLPDSQAGAAGGLAKTSQFDDSCYDLVANIP
jgi:hypothetical protein